MKKYIVATSALLVIATSAFSQGFVNFSGGANAATRISTNSVPGGASTGLTTATAGLYYYALFASSTQTSVAGQTTAISGTSTKYVFDNSSGWTLVGIAANTASYGRFAPLTQGSTSANQTALNADNSLTVQGIAGAATANFVCIGWSANIG